MNQICPKCRSLFDDSAQSCPDDESHLIEDLTGEIIAERYLLERFIGIGGMRAPVWRARQTSTRRTVAIKLMPQREGRPAHRFEREARIASNLNHRHIVVVHEYGTDERDQLFLVMEFLHGVSLRRVLRTGHPLPLERVLHITEQVLRALEHAHKHNVVHRDLKPDNMMLTTQDDDPDFVKILDFGIAKYYASEPDEEKPGLAPDSHELTQDSVLCGTPLYMAPEQITGESFDARIDLYALGIVMYQMLTGRVPFSGKTSYEILSKQIGEAPPLFREVRPELALSSELEEVVLRALEKDPGLRYQTAREMRLALRDVRRAVGVITQDTDEPSWAGPLPTAPVGGAGGRRGGAMAAPPPPPQSASRTLDPVPDDHLTQTLHPPSHIPSQRRPRRGGPWIVSSMCSMPTETRI
jgi:serine/threonine-protein kinase